VPNDERWPEHFRGTGIRIEDSICVDKDSPYILTTEAVKEVFDPPLILHPSEFSLHTNTL
jgi:intermediate cleaving peptidase 55